MAYGYARGFGYPTKFFEGNKVKGYIFKFVWLQDVCKSKMAVFRSSINYCYESGWTVIPIIRNQSEGRIGANMATYSFHGALHRCVSTMAALSQKQVKVNNMNILDTSLI